MQLIILRENLKISLLKTERAVTENNNLPILKNVLLTANSKLEIVSTNLEMAITTHAAAKIQQNGSISVPFQPLFSIVNNSVSERISLETEGNNLIVKTDNYEAKIQGNKPEDFPIIPEIKNSKDSLKINSKILNEALSEVNNAAQVSELKPELSGVLFDFQIGLLKLVATDSFRLAEKTILNTDFKTNFNSGFRVIIPLGTVHEILKIFQDEDVDIYFDDNQALFKSENSSIISRLINGEYPDYQAIIPAKLETTLTLDRSDLITAIKLVSNFSGRSSDLRIKLKEDSKSLEVYSSNQAVGENNYLVPVKREGGSIEAVAFNWRYLLSGLQAIRAEAITFGLNGAQKPSILKPVGDESLFYIVMPLEL